MRKMKFKFSNVSNLQIVMDFVKEIEAATGRKLTAIDIGGGLSSTYKDSEEPEAFAYRKYRHFFFQKCYLEKRKTPQIFHTFNLKTIKIRIPVLSFAFESTVCTINEV